MIYRMQKIAMDLKPSNQNVQQARDAVKMSRQELAEKVGIDPRYLANVEL